MEKKEGFLGRDRHVEEEPSERSEGGLLLSFHPPQGVRGGRESSYSLYRKWGKTTHRKSTVYVF
jgi:hypothetical protein